MDGCGICPSMALALICEGTEQVIQVDLKTILQKVMKYLGARDPPMYTMYDCGSNGFRVSVKLHVAAVKIHSGPKVHHVDVEGDTLPTRAQAYYDAAMKSLKYLRDHHHIKIWDYSSRVVRDIHANRTIGCINSAIYNVQQVVEKWGKVMEKCLELSINVEAKNAAVSVDVDGHFKKDVYEMWMEFLQMVLGKYNGRFLQARASETDLEVARQKIVTKSHEKYKAGIQRGHLQDVFLTCKDILQYVLTYIGSGPPNYTNGPNDENMTAGEVVFNKPDVPGIEFCGNIKIIGKSTNSRDAEEQAAFHALQYMERRYHLKIVDLNHAERLDVENEEKTQVAIVERLLKVGHNTKKCLFKILDSIDSHKRKYTADPSSMYAGPGADQKKEAYKFCLRAAEDFENYSKHLFDECTSRFEQLDKTYHELEQIKANLELD